MKKTKREIAIEQEIDKAKEILQDVARSIAYVKGWGKKGHVEMETSKRWLAELEQVLATLDYYLIEKEDYSNQEDMNEAERTLENV